MLLDALNGHAVNHPEAPALRGLVGDSLRSIDFRNLNAACRRFGERLIDPCGGGVLLLEAPGDLRTLVALLAGFWAGRAVLPVSPQTPPGEISSLVERVDAGLAIGSAAFLDCLPTNVRERVPAGEILEVGARSALGPSPARETGSLLLQSSGTSGPPKIVRRNGAGLHAVGCNVAGALSLGGTDVVLLSIPLHHSYALDMFAAALVGGCAVELHPNFVPLRVRAALQEEGITVWPAVPVMLDAISRGGAVQGRPPALRHVVSAGSPLPRRVYDQFEAAWGIRVAQIYGASEFGSITCGDPEAPDFDLASVGRPFSGVEVRVEPPGGEGEVLVASPTMMQEYLGEPSPFDAHGFLPTGDLGRLDGAGGLTLTGRIKFLIDVGGQKVNPIEVEQVLEEHPEVLEAIVLLVPWSDTSDRHHAVIVPETDCSPDADELRRFAQQRLSSYKVPRSFRVRIDVPRSSTGKVLRKQLEALERAPAEGR